MKSVRVAACVATICFSASVGATSATAKIYEITVPGRLISQGPGAPDPGLSLSDTFTLKARIDDRYFVHWGNGYYVSGTWRRDGASSNDPVPLSKANWSIQGGDYTWDAGDDVNDGQGNTIYKYDDQTGASGYFELKGPGLVWKDGKVVSVFSSDMYSVGPERPGIYNNPCDCGYYSPTGSTTLYQNQDDDGNPIGPVIIDEYKSAIPINNVFTIFQADAYENFRYTPGFTGVWDLEASTVTVVPEPSTWAVLIVGFGFAGAALRRRRGVALS